MRAHSTAELERKLRLRGCSSEEVAQALDRVRELGYVNDAEFAASLVRWREAERGRAAIAAELFEKGRSREVADGALAGLTFEAQVNTARRIASRSPGTDPRRIAARLQRRGFDLDTIRAALGDLDLQG
jgi:regulatory protein